MSLMSLKLQLLHGNPIIDWNHHSSHNLHDSNLQVHLRYYYHQNHYTPIQSASMLKILSRFGGFCIRCIWYAFFNLSQVEVQRTLPIQSWFSWTVLKYCCVLVVFAFAFQFWPSWSSKNLPIKSLFKSQAQTLWPKRNRNSIICRPKCSAHLDQ